MKHSDIEYARIFEPEISEYGSQWTAEEAEVLKGMQKEVIMAKRIAYVDQWALDRIMNVGEGKGMKWETDKCIYYAIGGYYDLLFRQKEINDMQLMTKEEAINKLRGTTQRDYSAEDLLSMLEAIGLIKFKSESETHTAESVLQKSINRQSAFPTGEISPRTLIVALKMKGYEIVKRHGITEL